MVDLIINILIGTGLGIYVFGTQKRITSLSKENNALTNMAVDKYIKKLSINDIVFPNKFNRYSSIPSDAVMDNHDINKHIKKGVDIMWDKMAKGLPPMHCIHDENICIMMAAVKNKNDDLYSLHIVVTNHFNVLKIDNVLFI